jgi:hypothetical protein
LAIGLVGTFFTTLYLIIWCIDLRRLRHWNQYVIKNDLTSVKLPFWLIFYQKSGLQFGSLDGFLNLRQIELESNVDLNCCNDDLVLLWRSRRTMPLPSTSDCARKMRRSSEKISRLVWLNTASTEAPKCCCQ